MQTLQDLMGADEIRGLEDDDAQGTLQRQKYSEAEKKRQKLEEDIKKEQEERTKKRRELLRKEKEYEKVRVGVHHRICKFCSSCCNFPLHTFCFG